ncbi:oxidoreductase [Pontibacillus litoralis JSM 072002]|uniref:Oxidoreductase n=1 Tax=Pontibacillus litoralis JSM 072002 TaxID=1385512 RepID=A0A0A5G681_9BACI|nr:oxidoreductase [Pontibacillus litoralis JSM 072002]
MVIGGGILGASAAYHLAKSGASVTIVDRQDKGQATEAAAGIICPWLSQRRNKKWYALVKGGAKYYPQLIQMLKEDGETNTGYKKVGALSLHTEEKKLDQMMKRAMKRREDAPEIGEITKLSPAETKALFPPLSEEYGAIHVSGGARVNGSALRQALLNAAQKNGALYINEHAEIVIEHNKAIGVRAGRQTIYAEHIIDTAGAWSKQLLQPLGVDFAVTPQKAQIIHIDLPNVENKDWPVVIPPTNKYLLTFGGGKMVIGATHEDDKGFDERVTVEGVFDILDKVIAIAPGLGDATYETTKVGFRPYTPDFLPVFGFLPGYEGISLANGLGASGLTSGPYLGAELAKFLRGEATELDPSLYNVSEAIK